MAITALENVMLKADAFSAAFKANRDVKTHQADNQVKTKLNLLLAAITQLQEEELRKHDKGLPF